MIRFNGHNTMFNLSAITCVVVKDPHSKQSPKCCLESYYFVDAQRAVLIVGTEF